MEKWLSLGGSYISYRGLRQILSVCGISNRFPSCCLPSFLRILLPSFLPWPCLFRVFEREV